MVKKFGMKLINHEVTGYCFHTGNNKSSLTKQMIGKC